MTCPIRKGQINPSRCLTCEHCGGLNKGGVLCFKAMRKIIYSLTWKTEKTVATS